MQETFVPHWHQWTDHPDRKSGLKWHIRPMNLTDIYRTFHLKAAEYTFKCTWNILQDRSLVVCWATRQALVNLRILKSNQASFYTTLWDQKPTTRKTAKRNKHARLNNMLLNNQEIKEEIKKYWKISEKNLQLSKTYGTQQKQL